MGLTYFSGDATNSSIWQRQKLQGLEASSAVLVDQKALASCNYASAFSTLSCMRGDLPKEYLHIFCNTSDSGPDQSGTRSFLRTLFAQPGFEDSLFVGIACLKHQYHLVARGQLQLIDQILKKAGKKYKYFSSLATLGHSWRGHLAKLRKSWSTHSNPHNEYILFKVPPLAVAGRWASVDSAELFYLQCGPSNVAKLLTDTFSSDRRSDQAIQDAQAEPRQARPSESDALDELSLNESMHYKEKVSKYLRNSLMCVQDAMFWFLMAVANKCREPLLHFYAWLCQPSSDDNFRLVQLVTSHIAIIRGEFDALCASFDQWTNEALTKALSIFGASEFSEREKGFLLTSALLILLHNAAAFNRRVARKFAMSGA
ncbi:unnamed protein product [Effrenium voratum]|nr:unnamed protein product [Effrenium voratum]